MTKKIATFDVAAFVINISHIIVFSNIWYSIIYDLNRIRGIRWHYISYSYAHIFVDVNICIVYSIIYMAQRNMTLRLTVVAMSVGTTPSATTGAWSCARTCPGATSTSWGSRTPTWGSRERGCLAGSPLFLSPPIFSKGRFY